MMNLAMRNYIKAFRWQNIKESYRNGGWFPLIYLALLLPFWSSNIHDEQEVFVGTSFIIIFPLIFAMFTSVLYPMALPKLMYLSPLSNEMRKDYILKACLIRTLTPLILTLLALIFLLSHGLADWLSAMGIFINHAIFAIFLGSGTNMKGYGSIDAKGVRSIPMDSHFSLMEAIIVFFCLMISFGHASCTAPSTLPVFKLLLIGTTLLIPLPATISYLKYWPSAVENSLSYENSLKKPTKLKK